MRTNLLILTLVSLLFIGCKSEPKSNFDVSETKVNITYDGGTVNLTVDSDSPWTATTSAPWLTLSSTSGEKSRVLRLRIDPSVITSDRTGTITISSAGKTKTVSVLQLARKDGVELKYRIPLIFHVLYYDKNNPKQNIPYDQILRILRETNEMYANAGKNSADLGIEFYLAEKDPQGRRLEEPGVVRVHWDKPTMNAPAFMNETSPEYISLIWNPNEYVNVMLYNFETPNLLGISTFPLVPEDYPIADLQTVPQHRLQPSDLKKVRCVSVNSLFADKIHSTGRYEVSETGVTLAHELGHYFGLRHTFSENSNALVTCQDTDNCMDTQSYNKQEYDQLVDYIFKKYDTDPEYKKNFDPKVLYMRQACYGEPYLCRNIMDYDFCTHDQFTEDQKRIVRHVLLYSPFIPGPKMTSDDSKTRSLSSKGITLPHSTSHCPVSLSEKYSKELSEINAH